MEVIGFFMDAACTCLSSLAHSGGDQRLRKEEGLCSGSGCVCFGWFTNGIPYITVHRRNLQLHPLVDSYTARGVLMHSSTPYLVVFTLVTRVPLAQETVRILAGVLVLLCGL